MNVVVGTYFIVFSIVYLVLFEVLNNTPNSEMFLWLSCLVLVINYAVSIAYYVRKNGSMVSVFFFLVLSCFIFNGGQCFLYLFDIRIRHALVFYNLYPLDIVCKSLWFQGCCLLGMAVGGSLAINITGKPRFVLPTLLREKDLPWNHCINLGFFLFSALSFYLYVDRLIVRSNMSYMDFMMGGYQESSIASFTHVMFFTFMSACFFKNNSRKWMIILISVNVATMVLMLLTGSRFKLVPVLVCLLFIFYDVKQNYHLLTLKNKLLYIVVFVFLFSLMRGWTFLRNNPLSSLDFQFIVSMYEDGFLDGFFDTLAECGSSIICLLCTVFQVDIYGAGGQSFLYSLLMSVVPYGVLDNFGLVPEITDLARWVTKLERATVGLGYSLYGEFYYNFRSLGFLAAFVFGGVFVVLEKKIKTLFNSDEAIDWLLAGCILCMLADSVFLGRANFLLITTNMRMCFYIILVKYFFFNVRKGG